MSRIDKTSIDLAEHRPRCDLRLAYHLAGQAAAIYLGNKQKQLPEVFFEIELEKPGKNQRSGRQISPATANGKLKGGRLIQSLPLQKLESAHEIPRYEQAQREQAFEADVSNLLAGSLAEAKYALLREKRAFTLDLLNLNVLQGYGFLRNLALINEYLDSFMPHKAAAERDQKFRLLLASAHAFVNQRGNWQAIAALARALTTEPKAVFSCEEVIALLESRMAA